MVKNCLHAVQNAHERTPKTYVSKSIDAKRLHPENKIISFPKCEVIYQTESAAFVGKDAKWTGSNSTFLQSKSTIQPSCIFQILSWRERERERENPFKDAI